MYSSFPKGYYPPTKPNFIFLSETLANKDRVDVVRRVVGFAGCIVVDVRGHSGGLTLQWRNEEGCIIKEVNNHFIYFEVQSEQVGMWRYTGFYGCPERSGRSESWEILTNLASKSSLPWYVIGDFNDLIFLGEKIGERMHPYNLLTRFAETVATCNLVDLGFVGEPYTWEKSRGTENWIQLNKRVYAPKSKHFKFENMGLKEMDCFNVVQNNWTVTSGKEILDIINYCCLQLEEWGGGVKLEYKKKLAEYWGKLRKMRTRRYAHGIQLYNEAQLEYLNLLDKQETYWQQLPRNFGCKKVLETRLKPCIRSLISDRQSVFVNGRLLTDNALIAFEVNHFMKRRKQGKSGSRLKIDISKAYDRPKWAFIRSMMDKFGLHTIWVDRGDPISPYIYIMYAEGLSFILRHNEKAGLLHGCVNARGTPSISHLLFADDCYFFFKSNGSEAGVMRRILDMYENISGQKINYAKSVVTFSSNVTAGVKWKFVIN
ncbi:uncharacterized protein LOC141719694 [Apium graveolens]|uniref:uncharacterized protein LOC141719694 n=1 Tax=Apium graveolens TaxID=4045 RepID=UPI003D79FFD5